VNGPSITCIGAAAVDRLHRATEAVVLGSATPATVSESHGGVARNIAQHLAAMGDDVTLLTALGADADGQRLQESLQHMGVRVVATHAARTASYVAVLDESGELVLAVVDMDATDHLDDAWGRSAVAGITECRLLLVDCNLGAGALAAVLAGSRDRPWTVVVEATSVTCSRRLPADLRGVDLLVANRRELAALTDADGPVDQLAALALARGAATVVALRGADGVEAFTVQHRVHVPAPTVEVVDVTGAGDAFTAGLAHALACDADLEAALLAGRDRAALALSGRGAVPG
jgi:pseudouridine kinase